MDWRAEARNLARELRSRGIRDERVLEQIAQVPRHEFVPEEWRREAYLDTALGIGHGQTISQPFIVALMTEAAEVNPTSRVLEIGTGSGYQAAILSGLCDRLITIERLAPLADEARRCWKRLGLENIVSIVADGTLGWPDEAPYDAIVVTAGAPELPPELTEQLANGGRLVIPVGPDYAQELVVYERVGGDVRPTKLCDCRFVRLIGRGGWPEDSLPTLDD